MEAAVTAARRGHKVTLCEAGDALGGRLRYPAALPRRRDFADYLMFQKRELRRLGVKVEFGRTLAAEDALATAPDVVVLATGAEPAAVTFPDGGEGLTLEAALDEPERLGRRIGLVDLLGHWATAATAEHLAAEGREVTIISPSGAPGWQINIYSSFAWRHRLRELKVAVRANWQVRFFRDGVALLEDGATGERSEIRFDSLIAPGHGAPRDGLGRDIVRLAAERGQACQVIAVGDAQSPRTALEAVYEGHEAGWRI
jgi:dimethylglycine catabolism A